MPFNIKNTIIATNGADCRSSFVDQTVTLNSQGYNLIQNTTGCSIGGDSTGNRLGVNPNLGPLQDNGGPTVTHALQPGSPAIEAGNPTAPGSGGNACAASDQRGVSRPQGTACDIGAFEVAAAPDTTVDTGPTSPTNSTNATFTFSGTPAGSVTFQCRLDGSAFVDCTSPASYSHLLDGSHTFEVRAEEQAGNVDLTPASFTWTVDTQAPVTSCAPPDGTWHSTDVALACSASDGGSGLASPADASFSLSTSVPVGTETASASTASRNVCDAVGNCTTAGPISGNKVDKKAPTITITTPAANATYPFRASVAANYGGVDGGSRVASCQGPVANGSPIDTSSMGTKTFTVTSNDNVGNQSTHSVSYTVGPAGGGPGPTLVPTNTALTLTPNPSVIGQAVTFTATVSASGSGTPTGTVSFKDAGRIIGTAALSGGQAVLVISTLKRGSHKITAVYSGDASFAASTSPVVTQIVQ